MATGQRCVFGKGGWDFMDGRTGERFALPQTIHVWPRNPNCAMARRGLLADGGATAFPPYPALPDSIKTISILMSAGVIPLMRLACPSVYGLNC